MHVNDLTGYCYEFGGGGGNRTRVRKHSALGSTCLVQSLGFNPFFSDEQENEQASSRCLTV